MRQLLFVFTVALVSLFQVAYAATPSRTTPPAARGHLSDAEVESAIRAKLAKSKIGKDGFTVHVKGGVATWEGTTSVIQHKGAATRMARTAGAVTVANKIKISDEARQKAAGNLSGIRRAQVKSN